ncbi:GM13279, related [Neospora caninum Liverpool]|uniref:GM13279, related n=1 Tax=Neospora caninum (strain Liverpool) TaxID=572307 RepID=F0VFL3_NEOCL|nr:GM13279, related [Neospora caninum Liverpool]CBZ52507.1 GM13279, related [Neospora caninum Liverpool]CEL66484.1 TPA: GM13279, related [Neospora caninum Liverpool]|eukprot:XP_003882539.1 GM13279, related [Neospora caninum Liverpool]
MPRQDSSKSAAPISREELRGSDAHRRGSSGSRKETPGACGGDLPAASRLNGEDRRKRSRSPELSPGRERRADRETKRQTQGGGLARLLEVAAGASAAAAREVEARREAALKRAAQWHGESRREVERSRSERPCCGLSGARVKHENGGPAERRSGWDVKSEGFHERVKQERKEELRENTEGRSGENSKSARFKREGDGDAKYAWGRPASETGTGLLKDDSRRNGKDEQKEEQKEVLKPNFEPSGLLKEEQGENSRNGVSLKHTEPADAAMPTKKWRLYMFKKDRTKPAAEAATQPPDKTLHLHRRSSFIFGKDNRVADILLMHPTISKQHAVLQFRKKLGDVSPYIIDLESTNGTYLNGEKIETCRYYQLREQDTLRFGKSSRDFVLLHTGSVAVDISYNSFLDSRHADGQMSTD